MSGGARRVVLATRGLDPIGTGRQVLLAAEGLIAEGWDVHVAVLSRGGSLARPLARAGATVHAVASRPSSGRMLSAAAVPPAFATLLRRLDADVVEAWGWTSSMAAALGLGMLRFRSDAPPLVLRVATPPGRSWRRAWTVGRSAVVLADGEGVTNACRLAFPTATVRTLPPGIPSMDSPQVDREAVAARFGLRCDAPWTLCVAPLESDSRLERLVWAMDQLDVVRKGIEHVLVGTGSQASRIARRARVQQVAERLHRFPSRAMMDLSSIGELIPHVALVWQSGEVALGGAILDAMAAGRPAVAVDGAVARNLIEQGVTGRIAPAIPSSEFPREAFRLLEDPSLASRLGEAARNRAVVHFPADRFLASHAEAIASVARRGSGG